MSASPGFDLPGLSTALDVEAVLDLLRNALRASGEPLELIGGSVVDVRYRPNQPCWILYRLKVRDPGGRSRHDWISGQVLRPGQSSIDPPADLVNRYGDENGRFPIPVLHVDEPPITLHAYPLDGSLPGLFDAASSTAMRERLQRLWGDRRVKVRDVEVHPLGYTPHARAAFAYEVLNEFTRTGAPEIRRLIGKLHAKKPAARLFADAWAVWRAAKGRIGLAPPVGLLDPIGLTLQERVPGTRLGGLVDRPGFMGRARRTARMLAKLHSLSVPLSSRRKMEEELKGIRRWAGILAEIKPELRDPVTRLRDRLLSEVESRFRLSGPIHADFHHTNVLVDGDRITIIDLDEMAYGDPMVDVGRFLASLRVPARRAFGELDALDEAGDVFLEEYLRCVDADERRARLFESASLLIAAGSSFRIQRAGWEEEVRLLVEQSERTLTAATVGRSVAVGEHSELASDSWLDALAETPPKPGPGAPSELTAGARPEERSEAHPEARPDQPPELSPEARMKWARDGLYMQAVLTRAVRVAYGVELERCRAKKKGDRAGKRGIRLELRGRRNGDDWSTELTGEFRERGGLTLFRRLQRLREAMDDLGDGTLLPRPIDYVKRLKLLIWETPEGTPLSRLIGSGRLPELAARLGEDLAALHRAPVDLGRTRSLEAELRSVRQRVRRLTEARPALARRAAALLEETESRITASPQWTGPSLRTLPAEHLVCASDASDRLVLDTIDDVTMSHPLIDVGDVVARWLRLGLRRGALEEAETAIEALTAAYRRAAEVDGALFGPFEAAALLRLAGNRRARESDNGQAEALLELAARRLAGQSVAEPSAASAAAPAPALAPALAPAPAWGTSVSASPDVDADASGDRPGAGPDEAEARKSRSRRAERGLRRAVARRCRGRTLVLGVEQAELAEKIRTRDIEVTEGDLATLQRLQGQFGTVVVGQLPVNGAEGSEEASNQPADQGTDRAAELTGGHAEQAGERAASVLRGAWELVEPGGRLIAVVPNADCRPDDGAGPGLTRKQFERLLRPFGKPKPGIEQPYRWLAMEVRKREKGSGRRDRSRTDRFRVTAELCVGRVVELGCGEGQLAKTIADHGHEVMGVDIGRRRIAKARELFPDLDFIRSDIQDVDLPPHSFDTAVLAEVLEHVSDDTGVRILEKAWSLVRGDGRLIVSVPNENCIPHPNHLRQFDRQRLSEMLRPFGRPIPVGDQPFKWLLMYVEKSSNE